MTIYFGSENGFFNTTKSYSTKGQTLKGIIAADFDEDGLYDLAIANNNNNNIAILLQECH